MKYKYKKDDVTVYLKKNSFWDTLNNDCGFITVIPKRGKWRGMKVLVNGDDFL